MPAYTYRCNHCHSEFTLMRAMKDYDSPALCSCGKRTRERLITSCAVKLSGSTRPSSPAEKLAGRRVKVPEVKGATSVLGHACHSGCSH